MIIAVSHLLKFPTVFSPLLSVFLRESLSVNGLMTSVGFFFLFRYAFNILICSNSSANLTVISLVMCWEVRLVCEAILPCCSLKLSYPPVLSVGLHFVSYLWNGTLWPRHKDGITAYRAQQYGSGSTSVTSSQNSDNKNNDSNILSVQVTIFWFCCVFRVSPTG